MKKAEKKEVTIEGMLYTHYESTTEPGTHPVKIKVTANRKTRYYPVQLEGKNLFLTPEQWAARGKKIRDVVSDTEAKAREAKRIITHNRPFTFDRFQKEFLNAESEKGILALFEETIAELLAAERIGNYNSVTNAYSAFKAFRGSREIMPEDLTPEILKSFDVWLRKEKKIVTKTKKETIRKANKTTVAIYMRALKSVVNTAISRNPALAEFYPFSKKQNDKGKYKIKSGSGHKGEALSVEDLQKLIATTPIQGTQEWTYKLLWLFSFYCQGMNFKDVFFLKYKNVQWDAIRYVRKKTEETEEKEQLMEIPLSDSIKEIILQIGNPDKNLDSYVFECLQPGMDANRQTKVIKQKIKVTNKWLKIHCEAAGIPKITTYWARHSYASLLKAAGESTEMIQELLGHGDPKTTEAYLKRFELSKKQKVNEKIHAVLKVS